MRKMTGHFKKKKADSDTRTIEEIMTALDLSTACSMLINQVAHCPDSSGRPMDSLTRKYLQNALRDEIPLSQRGEAKGSMFRHTHIPPEPQWTGWSRNLKSNINKAAVEVVADHVFGEPEASFEASYGASSGAAQKPRYRKRGPGCSSPKTADDVGALTGYQYTEEASEPNQFGQQSSPQQDSDHEYDDLRDELGEIILMSGARGGTGGDPSASPSSTDTLVKKIDRDEQRTTAMSRLNSLKRHPDPEVSQYAQTVATSAATMAGEDLSRAVKVIEVLRDMSDQQLDDGAFEADDDAERDGGEGYPDQEGIGYEEDGSDGE